MSFNKKKDFKDTSISTSDIMRIELVDEVRKKKVWEKGSLMIDLTSANWDAN